MLSNLNDCVKELLNIKNKIVMLILNKRLNEELYIIYWLSVAVILLKKKVNLVWNLIKISVFNFLLCKIEIMQKKLI